MCPSLSIPKGSCDRAINYSKRSHWQKVFWLVQLVDDLSFLGINSRRVVSFHPEFRSHRTFRGKKKRKGNGEANKVQLQFFWAFLQNSYPSKLSGNLSGFNSVCWLYFRLTNEVVAWRQSNSKRNRKFNILGKNTRPCASYPSGTGKQNMWISRVGQGKQKD